MPETMTRAERQAAERAEAERAAEAELLASVVRPVGIDPLPEGALACHVCGVAVLSGLVEEFTSNTYHPRAGHLVAERVVEFRTCAECRDRHGLAALLMEANPGVRARIGAASIANHRAALALDVMAAAGSPVPGSLSAEHLRMALDVLSAEARRWAARFSPSLAEGALVTSCAERPWSWLSPDDRADVKRAVGRWQAYRMPPRAVECPTGGCGYCGIGTVTAARWQTPWTAHSMSPGGLGGSGPRNLDVSLCMTCEAFHADPFGTGPGPMGSALLEYVDPGRVLRGGTPHEPEPRGVRGWAVSGRTEPNATPWAHLDVDGLRESIRGYDWR
ncbi:hypothetical protein [Agromyces sp. PvR057]|uniref:hypothetical protein n=1 Tax=Agromyces sp. PvR057 TaxID=3156403 RepID=UPI0033997864